MYFTFQVSLPNNEPATVILDERQSGNYISQSIVDCLSKMGEIVVDDVEVFVEFYRTTKNHITKRVGKYFDGAKCIIQPKGTYICLGYGWMQERQVIIDPNGGSNIVQPAHLNRKFRFPDSYLQAVRDVKKTLQDFLAVVATPPVHVWYQSLFVDFGLDLVNDSMLTADSSYEIIPTVILNDV